MPSKTQQPIDSTRQQSEAFQFEAVEHLKNISNILDESLTANGVQRKVEFVKPEFDWETSTELAKECRLSHVLRLLEHTLWELEGSLLQVERALIPLPGSERVMDIISKTTKTIHGICIPDIIEPKGEKHRGPSRFTSTPHRLRSFLSEFTADTVEWRRNMELLMQEAPKAAPSVRQTILACILDLEKTYRMCHFLASAMDASPSTRAIDSDWAEVVINIPTSSLAKVYDNVWNLNKALQETKYTLDRLTVIAAPYLSDRRRSLKDNFLAISAISALFCTMPVDLMSSAQSVDSGTYAGAIIVFAFLSTTASASAFISSLLIVRFMDEEFSLLPEPSVDTKPWFTLWTPVLFLSLGGASFFTALTLVALSNLRHSNPSVADNVAMVAVLVILMIAVIGLIYVAMRLHRFLESAKAKRWVNIGHLTS